MPKGKLTRAGKSIVIGLGLWAAAVIVPDFWRVFDGYATLGFEADNDGRIYAVFGAPAEGVLKPGDQIDLRRTRLADLLAVVGGMGGMQHVRPGLDVELFVVQQPPAPSSPITLHARSLPWCPESDSTPICLLRSSTLFLQELFGVMFIVLGAILVWQLPTRMTWGFFLYGIWFNPGQYFVLYAELQRWPYVLLLQEIAQAIAQAVGYAGFVIFALRFPRNSVEDRWQFVERGLPYVVIVLASLQLWSFGTALGFPTETVTRLSYHAGYAIDVLVLAILWISSKRQVPEDRQRTRWVLWGCALGLLAFIFADSNAATNMLGSLRPSESVLSLFYLGNATVVLAIFYAVRRHRVINVSFAVSRGATLLLTWIVIGAALVALNVLAERYLEELRVGLFYLAVVVVALLFEWLHERLNELCDRIFFRRLHEAEKELQIVGANLADGESLAHVDRQLVAEPVRNLDLVSGALFRRQGSEASYRRVQAIGWGIGDETEVPATHALIDRLEICKCPIVLDDDAGQTRFASSVLAIPILCRGMLLAVCFYGMHGTGDDINKEERSILGQLAKSATNAYESLEANLLRRQVDELSQKLKQATHVGRRGSESHFADI